MPRSDPRSAMALCRCVWRGLFVLVSLAVVAPAQGGASPDEDPASLPVTTLVTNAVHSRRNTTVQKNAHAVRDYQVYSGRQILVSDCDLLVDEDGHLRLENCWLRVDGDVFLKDRGVLELVDCRVQLENTYPRQYNYWFEGGELRTTRCVIGGTRSPGGASQIATYQLHRGLWRAIDTTVQYSGGILIGQGRLGLGNDPFLRGGSLHADGLHQGVDADAVIASGYGDIVLRNSTFSLNLSLYADSGQAAQAVLDFPTNELIQSEVYGDRSVIDSMPLSRPAITHDVPGLPYRLEISNSFVPFWFVHIYGVTSSGPTTTFEFRDPTGLNVGIHAEDLQGSPSAIGPWSTYTSRIPQLPCVGPGGADEIPPGCGVRIGNVEIVAPANRSTRISAWSFYIRGANTSFSVQGPTKLAEVVMLEGQMSVTGDEAYDARLSANTINLHGDASLDLENVSLGRFEATVAVQRYIELQGAATCTVTNALVDDLRVRSKPEQFWGPYQGVEATTFQITDFVEVGSPIDAVATGQSTFTVQRATPAQSFDLVNADLDLPPVGGAPSHWASTNLTATASSDVRPSSGSFASNEVQSTAATASMTKSVPLAGGCFVEVRAWIKPLQVPPGSSLTLRVAGSTSGTTSVAVPLAVPAGNNGWAQVILPPHRVDRQDGPIDVGLVFSGSGLAVRVDDVQVRPTQWWDRDALANLDFDQSEVFGFLFPPAEYRYPAFWGLWGCDAVPESAQTRPNAAAGSHGIRLVNLEGAAQVYKTLSDIAEGTTVVVTGWMRVVASQPLPLKVHVGDDARWWDQHYGSNQLFYVHNALTWTQFSVSYTVPPGVPKIRIAITGADAGAEVLVDDVQVTFQ